jgi:uncharacterized paraquat-inducible protein A
MAMFDYHNYPLFGSWYSKRGIYVCCPRCGYLNKTDVAKYDLVGDWDACPNCGASLTGMSFRQKFGRIAIALLIAAAIFYVFYGWIF